MKFYDNYHASKPVGIADKKVYIVGGGIAGMACAAFMIDDGYLPGKNVTIYEKLPEVGGCMDGVKAEQGYLCRGERELEPYMECLWYLFSKIPSIDSPGMTVLDETVRSNQEDPIFAQSRILYEQGKVYEQVKNFKTSDALAKRMAEMLMAPEESLYNMTIEEFYGDLAEELYHASFWLCFHSMLAFKHYHSVLEMKRYMIRFLQFQPRCEELDGILHTKYNEYDSMIKPLKAWLSARGVTFITDCSVYDLEMDAGNNTVTALRMRVGGAEKTVAVRENDAVVVTNGSMTTNSTFGDNTHVAPTNRDKSDMGVFTIWQNLAARDAKFGRPEVFTSDIDKSKWMSIFPTVVDYPQFFERVYQKYGYAENTTTGAITVMDSAWDISMVFYTKYFPEQKDNEQVFWFDALYGENVGDYIKKPAAECTGEEILTELLYHLDMLDMKDELLAHTYISTCMMPYITSQFMPRGAGDRPNVIPTGCTNLALIGQFVELPGDVVFTVETSVRTAMMAAYGLLQLDKPVVPIYEGQFDVRILAMAAKKMLGTNELTVRDLPPVNPLKLKSTAEKLVGFVNGIPEIGKGEIVY